MTIKVLVVDDSPLARKMIISSLPEEWRADVRQAPNGKVAIEEIEKGNADITFLDLTMPEMDGYDVLKYIKEKNLNTVTVVVSADIQDKAREAVMGLGAMDFIKKPVNIDALRSIINKYGLSDH